MKRILVTGAAGFIGSNFVKMVLEDHPGTFVASYDKLTYAGNLENLAFAIDNPDHVFVRGDIGDARQVEEMIKDYQLDGIVNFAAESHVDRSILDPGIFIETNVTGTLTLLKAAVDARIEKFVQVSTDEVYGSLGREGKFTETSSITPNSPYSASKAGADHLVHAFAHTWGLNASITRCSNNYGPYQFPEKMIPLMINNALKNKPLPVYGDGLYIRDWLYVYDHCTAVWEVLNDCRADTVFNIGGNNEKTNLDVVRAILGHLNKPESLIAHVKDRPGHDRRYAIDSTKMMQTFGWKPSVTFEEGLEKTIQWYLDNSAWLEHVVSGQYQQYYENMYRERC